jgi:DNA topoisomerase-2
LDGTIDLRKKTKAQVIQMLEEKDYDKIENDDEYKYLTKMPMDSVTEENVDKLRRDKGNKDTELETIKGTTINQMWTTEIDKFKDLYIEYKEDRERLMNGDSNKQKKKVISKGPIKKTQKVVVEDD